MKSNIRARFPALIIFAVAFLCISATANSAVCQSEITDRKDSGHNCSEGDVVKLRTQDTSRPMTGLYVQAMKNLTDLIARHCDHNKSIAVIDIWGASCVFKDNTK
jgi:hypothetical protein